MNIGEATDVNLLLDYLYAPPPGSYRTPRQQPAPESVRLAAEHLAERAHHALGCGWSRDEMGAAIARTVESPDRAVPVHRYVDRSFARPDREREE